jgi:hypothetical protein
LIVLVPRERLSFESSVVMLAIRRDVGAVIASGKYSLAYVGFPKRAHHCFRPCLRRPSVSAKHVFALPADHEVKMNKHMGINHLQARDSFH